MRIHLAKGLTDFIRDRRHRFQIKPERYKISDAKQSRCKQERRSILRNDKKRNNGKQSRTDHEIRSGAKHEVDLAYIVGGARHRVADRLEIMEGHAFSKQGNVKFVANIAFHLLRRQLRAEVASKLEDA